MLNGYVDLFGDISSEYSGDAIDPWLERSVSGLLWRSGALFTLKRAGGDELLSFVPALDMSLAS